MEQTRRSVLRGVVGLGIAGAALGAARLVRAERAEDESDPRGTEQVVNPGLLALLESRFRRIVRRGLGESYRAPLLCEPQGLYYLGGGVDPIAAIELHDRTVEEYPGAIASVSGRIIGPAHIYLDIEYPIRGYFERVLFVSQANKALFEEKWHRGQIAFLNGLNCLWGVASGPITDYRHSSHWAQPGLAGIVVEHVNRRRGGDLTALGLNLHAASTRWNVKGMAAWESLSRGYIDLLTGSHAWAEPQRPGMPILQVAACRGCP